VGGTGVTVGNWGVGVPVGVDGAQAEMPKMRSEINRVKKRIFGDIGGIIR